MRPIYLGLVFLFTCGSVLADPVSLTGTVTPQGNLFQYHYELRNTTDPELSQRVTEFLLPLFRLEDVEPGSVVSPSGWSHEFLTGAAIADSSWSQYIEALFGNAYLPHSFLRPPVVLRWFADPDGGLFPDAIGEFAFLSQYSETNAPYVATLVNPSYAHVGDPPIPFSGPLITTPEPVSFVLFGTVGLVGVAMIRRRHREKSSLDIPWSGL